jgi:MFS family permease
VNGAWLKEYVPPTRDGRRFAIVSLADSTGTGFYIAGGTVFFIMVMRLSVTQVGLGLTIGALVGFLAAVPVGSLVLRLGALRAFQVLQLWRGFWFCVLAFAHGFPELVAITSLMSLAQGPIWPMTQLIVGAIVQDEDRTKTMASIRSIRNVGFSLGALSAVPLLGLGTAGASRWVVIADSLSFLVSAALLRAMRTAVAPEGHAPGHWYKALSSFRDWRYLSLTIANAVLALHSSLLAVGLPLFVIHSTKAPHSVLGVLVATNTILAVTLQVRFARGVSSSRAGSRALRNGGLSLALCCLILVAVGRAGVAMSVGLLLVAVALLTFGEMWQSVGAWDLSVRHAPKERRPQYLMAFYLGAQAETIVGPALFGFVVATRSMLAWVGTGLFFALAAGATARLGACWDRPFAAARKGISSAA